MKKNDVFEGVRKGIQTCTVVLSKERPDSKEYTQARRELNCRLLEVLFGATIGTNSKDPNKGEIAFNRPMPSIRDLTTILAEFEEFYHNVEYPRILGTHGYQEVDPESDDIPGLMMAEAIIPQYDKIKISALKKDLVGDVSCHPIIDSLICPSDIMKIASIGEAARKVIIRNRVIVIGGITLAVVGAAVATGLIVHNHKKKNNDTDQDADTIEIDSGDIPSVDMDDEDGNDDIPSVDIDDI